MFGFCLSAGAWFFWSAGARSFLNASVFVECRCLFLLSGLVFVEWMSGANMTTQFRAVSC